MTTQALERGKVRVTIGPYNTTCKTGDVWEVKKLLQRYADEHAERCKTCGQTIKEKP